MSSDKNPKPLTTKQIVDLRNKYKDIIRKENPSRKRKKEIRTKKGFK